MIIRWFVFVMCIITISHSTETKSHRVFAVGDLHGDFKQSLRAFRLTKTIDEDGNWIGENSVVVQLGDVVDRGPDSRLILDWLQRLKSQAQSVGGRIVQILGNHELMAFKGRTKYTHKGDIESFGTAHQRTAAFAADGPYGYLRQCDTIVVLNRTLFVHAGLTPRLANMSKTSINNKVRQHIIKNQWHNPLMTDDGPQWSRFLIRSAEKGNCEPIYDVLDMLKNRYAEPIDRIVVGHTIQYTHRVMQFCQNRLVATDVAMSSYLKLGAHNLGGIEILPIPDPYNPTSMTKLKLLSANVSADDFGETKQQFEQVVVRQIEQQVQKTKVIVQEDKKKVDTKEEEKATTRNEQEKQTTETVEHSQGVPVAQEHAAEQQYTDENGEVDGLFWDGKRYVVVRPKGLTKHEGFQQNALWGLLFLSFSAIFALLWLASRNTRRKHN